MFQDTLIVGHRGFSSNYPENTLLAIEKAYEHGANGVELDVEYTSDGEFVLMHDTTVDRTTNGSGRVDSFTVSQITQLDAGSWKGSQFANREDTKVPRLTQVFDYIQNKDVFVFLHVKSASFNETRLRKIVDLVNTSNVKEKVIFMGESNSGIIRNYDSEIKVFQWGASTNSSNYIARLNSAIQYNFTPFGVGTNVTRSMIETVNSHNIPTIVSYVSSNFNSETERLLNLGADMIYTDNVIESMKAVNNKGLTQIKPSTYVWKDILRGTSVSGLTTPIYKDTELNEMVGYINLNGNIEKVTIYVH